jgi:uncharacterized membrane protein
VIFSNSILINCPLEIVWHYYLNFDNMSDWDEDFESASLLSGKIGEKNSRYLINYFPKNTIAPSKVVQKILKIDEYKKFKAELRSSTFTSIVTVKFKQLGEMTNVSFIVELSFKNWFYNILGFWLKVYLQQQQIKSLGNLKRILETKFWGFIEQRQ